MSAGAVSVMICGIVQTVDPGWMMVAAFLIAALLSGVAGNRYYYDG